MLSVAFQATNVPKRNTKGRILGEKLILFDGTSNTLDLHILDILSLQWETHRVKKLDSFKRKEMSVNQLIRKKLILFGGFKEDKLSSDVSILNTESFKWQVLPQITKIL